MSGKMTPADVKDGGRPIVLALPAGRNGSPVSASMNGQPSAVKASAVVIEDLTKHYGIVPASSIAEEDVTWLWEGYLPDGALVLIEGDPDTGKTLLALNVAAAVAAGRSLPTGPADAAKGRNVLYLTSEDSLSKTIVKRLRAADANLDRVMVQNQDGAELLLPDCLEHLRYLIRECQARVVVMDALNDYLDASKVKVNNEQEVRAALKPLRRLAEEENVTIIGLRHLNKATDKPAMYRGGGSIALAAVARSVLLVARHPEDKDLRVVVSQKCNLIEDDKRRPLGFRIARDENGRPRMEWVRGEIHINAEELLSSRRPGPQPRTLERAKAYLQDHLQQGPKLRRDVVDMAAKVGLGERAIERAARKLDVRSEPLGKERMWSLPPSEGGRQ